MTRSSRPAEVAGRVCAPPSKSSMQRAVACAALAEGRSAIIAPSRSGDSLAALSVAAALGAKVRDRGDRIEVEGIPASAFEAVLGHDRHLSCGESGLALRMFTPIAALFAGPSLLEAEGSLRTRPVTAIEAPLAALGVAAGSAGGFPPVRVEGRLRGGRAKVDASASSQFLTGLLVALPLADGDSEILAPQLVSSGYIGLTLNTMAAFGIDVDAAQGLDSFRIAGGRRYRSTDFRVEGDWSGGAFLLVAGAIAAGSETLRVEGLQADSGQPDRAILDALKLSGASVAFESGAGGTTVVLRRAGLSGFEFDATDCPDLFPPLVALASACRGETRLRGASRLRAKESDRAAVLAGEFGKLGVAVKVEGDLMRIRGSRPQEGRVDSHGDHRIAMAAAVAALAGEGEILVDGADCVAKSWPGFWEDLATARIP